MTRPSIIPPQQAAAGPDPRLESVEGNQTGYKENRSFRAQNWTCESHRGVAVDVERGHGVRAERRLVPAALKAVLGEVGRTNGRPEAGVPVNPTHGLQPVSQNRQVVQRKPANTQLLI